MNQSPCITIATQTIGERYADLRIIQPVAENAMERSMQNYGHLTPVVVGQVDDRYEMVDGFKRLRAGRKLGLETLQASVLSGGRRALKVAIVHLNARTRTIADLETDPERIMTDRQSPRAKKQPDLYERLVKTQVYLKTVSDTQLKQSPKDAVFSLIDRIEKTLKDIRKRQELDHRIITMHAQRWSIRALSRHFDMGRNTIWRILRKNRSQREKGYDVLDRKRSVARPSKPLTIGNSLP